MDGDALVVENASSVMLLTRIDIFPTSATSKVEALRLAVEGITPDYPALLDRHQRSSRRCSTASPWTSAAPRNMDCRRGTSDRSAVAAGLLAALLEKIFEMGRHWFIVNSGKYPSIAAEVNSTIDLQTASACRATCGKAWRPTSTGWRVWRRITAPTPRTSSDFAALRIPSFQTRVSAPISITPAAPESELALLDFRGRLVRA